MYLRYAVLAERMIVLWSVSPDMWPIHLYCGQIGWVIQQNEGLRVCQGLISWCHLRPVQKHVLKEKKLKQKKFYVFSLFSRTLLFIRQEFQMGPK